MTKEHIKQDISHLLETITEQIEMIYSHSNKIPQIELDIILNNIRNLYEQLNALSKLNSKAELVSSVESEPSIVKEIKDASILLPAMNIAETEKSGLPHSNDNVLVDEPVESQKEKSITEQIEIITSNIVEEQVAVAPIQLTAEPVKFHKEEPKINMQQEVAVKAGEKEEKHVIRKPSKTAASLFDAAPSIGDKFDDSKTLKEKISSTHTGRSIADKIHHQKIDDLKKEIGINEKFLFINELFEGSLASYNEHIEKLNASSDVHHARSIIDSLIAKYNWDAELQIVKKFLNLVERRFN